MNIMHFGSLAAESGGPADTTYLSIKGERNLGISSEILMPQLKKEQHLYATDIPISFYSNYLHLLSLLSKRKIDIFHIQGIWNPAMHLVARHARREGVPYVVTLHGMLYPQALASKSLKKKFALALYQKTDLCKAACIHATCTEEQKYYRDLGFTNPVAVIPNPVKLPAICPLPPKHKKDFCIGFLGRLHPRKKVEKVLYALASDALRNKPCRGVIIGGGEKAYENYLIDLSCKLGLKNVVFTGFLQGEERTAAIRSLSALVLPSDFENFGMVVSDALKEGVPVISTQGAPWQCLETYHCGYWVPNSVESISSAIQKIMNLSLDERYNMGKNGQQLLRDKYEFENVSKKMVMLYQWIVQGGSCPDFVEVLNA